MSDRLRPLLDQIGSIESAKGYDYEFGNKHIPLSEMTIGEVLEHQKRRRKEGARSSAVGRYQFIWKTLNDIAERNPKDFPKDALFTPELQDKAATVLLKRRGLDDYMSGKMDTRTFGKNLAKEWASLPDPDTGSSYYDKDGLNKSLVDVDTILNTAEMMRRPEEEVAAIRQEQINQMRNQIPR